MNYLPVSVYRDLEIGDCTNGGVTSNPDNYFVVPCEDGHVTEEIVEKRGYIVLEPMEPAYKGCPIRVKPRGVEGWYMNGGNFVYTSDSRFRETYGPAPISVHDRKEW